MGGLAMHVEQVLSFVDRHCEPNRRSLIAIAGPPGSGKSTLAAQLVNRLNENSLSGEAAALVPMDGFHLDVEALLPLGLVNRRGAPETFDREALDRLLKRIRANEGDVNFPLFDRVEERSLRDAGVLKQETPLVVVEGNYLLLDRPGWRDLKPLFDATVFLNVSPETLEHRLMARWLDLGFSDREAAEKVHRNDLLNAELVAHDSLPADLVLDE